MTALVAGALLLPVGLDRDSYPLSTYPMYSRVRADEVGIVTARGLDSAGARRELPMATIAATDDPLVAEALLRRDVRSGRDARDQLCAEIAGRVDDPTIVAVEVVTEVHDVVAQASRSASLVRRTVHASCDVPR